MECILNITSLRVLQTANDFKKEGVFSSDNHQKSVISGKKNRAYLPYFSLLAYLTRLKAPTRAGAEPALFTTRAKHRGLHTAGA